jgi:hypothetical protein
VTFNHRVVGSIPTRVTNLRGSEGWCRAEARKANADVAVLATAYASQRSACQRRQVAH